MPNSNPSPNIVRSVVQTAGSVKLVYCSAQGIFLGEVSYLAANPAMLKLMADDFAAYVREAASSILRPATPGQASLPLNGHAPK